MTDLAMQHKLVRHTVAPLLYAKLRVCVMSPYPIGVPRSATVAI